MGSSDYPCLPRIPFTEGKKGTCSGSIRLTSSGRALHYQGDELDYIRQIGKFAAHAKSDRATGEIIDVDKEEAEAMLSIIDLLCDHYYVMPAKATRRHQQLEEKLQASKAKPVEK